MLLAVDIGNSQTSLGLFSPDGNDASEEASPGLRDSCADELKATWRIASDPSITKDELFIKVDALLRSGGYTTEQIRRVVVGSVVPALTDIWTRIARSISGAEALIVTGHLDSGLTIGSIDPSELGADLLADAVAGVAKYGRPIIVADFGTATTLEIVDHTGDLLGGSIAPGIMTSASALFHGAALLAQSELDMPQTAIGHDTSSAVAAGILLGEGKRVDGLVRMMIDELGETPRVIATGGLASLIAPVCEMIETVDPALTLEGLCILAKRN